MKQYTENQYDDDLTIGTDDYDDSYYTGSVDLFEFSNDDESPISRLKSLILSIDWEITDEVLMQFNEELFDLRDIWAKEKINLIYVQALEKISKYIYQKKADSHPSAIKLLLTLYHNLEKIVSSSDLTEDQKKEILLEDVKRFEQLKTHISNPSGVASKPPVSDRKVKEETTAVYSEKELQTLKAIVLGIDWEITDDDLNALRQEVVKLEAKFADSRPRLILLQGIGTLGAYIKLKKSDAHADAFKILHLFYDCLERIVRTPMTLVEEKAILFPAVEKFNSFKALLGPTISAEAISRTKKDSDEDTRPSSSQITPAFSDLPEEEVIGFQAEEEAKALGFESSENVDDHVESFFMGTSFETLEAPVIDESEPALSVDQEIALQGVDVEIDDEESDDIVTSDNRMFAVALDDEVDANQQPVLNDAGIATENEETVSLDNGSGDLGFLGEDHSTATTDFGALDRDVLLQGVDVETEADDDSDEDALPMLGGELAPALADNEEESIYNAELFETSTEAKNVDDEIAGSLGGFFAEKDDSHISGAQKIEEDESESASEIAGFDGDGIGSSSIDNYLFDDGSEEVDLDNSILEESFEESDFISLDEDEVILKEEKVAALKEENEIDAVVDTEIEGEEEAIALASEPALDESQDSFFDEGDLEQDTALELEEILSFADDGEQVFLEDGSEIAPTESEADIDDNIDSFFGLPEEDFSEEADKLLFDEEDAAVVEESGFVLENDVAVAMDEPEEEEVVFELVEEFESPVEIAAIQDPDQPDGMEADEFPLPESGGDFSAQITDQDNEEDIAAIIDDSEPGLRIDISTETFGSLRTCVDSLGVELDDKVISGLWREIDHLENILVDKPMEKTFLQLVRTISRHIDQNRYDSNSDAYVLLQSVSNALIDLQEDDLLHNQEMLLAETQNVLKWQEELLVQQTAKSEAELTIDDTDGFLQQGYGEDYTESSSNNEDFDLSEQKMQVFAQGQERLANIEKKEILTDDLKKEIATLRQSLQDEITALRNELKGN